MQLQKEDPETKPILPAERKKYSILQQKYRNLVPPH